MREKGEKNRHTEAENIQGQRATQRLRETENTVLFLGVQFAPPISRTNIICIARTTD